MFLFLLGIFLKRLTCLYSTRERLRIVGVLLEKVHKLTLHMKICFKTVKFFKLALIKQHLVNISSRVFVLKFVFLR